MADLRQKEGLRIHFNAAAMMQNRVKRALPDLLVIACLLLVPLAFFAPQTLGGHTLLPIDNLFAFAPYKALAPELGVGVPHNALISDLILQNTAWKQFALSQLRAGQLPLWQPNIAAGAPFLAAGQASILYPLTLLTLLLPVPAGYGWFTVLQLWIAGINLYALARTFRLGRGPALIAALSYQMSSFMLVSVVFPMIIGTAAWLPLILALIEKTLRRDAALGGRPAALIWVLGGACALGMAVLAGHVEALYFTLLVAAFYTAWRLIGGLVSGDGWRWAAESAGWVLTLAVLGLALGAVQLMPAYELASRSFREGAVTLEQVRGWAYPPRHLLAFLLPNFYGSPAHHHYFDAFTWRWQPVTVNALGDPITNTAWGIKNYVEGGAYLGLLPLTLAALALFDWFKGRTRPAVPTQADPRPIFGVLGLLSLSFIFGTPTYALIFYGLPFINQSHSPFRWVWPLTLCAALLAGFGAQALERLPRAAKLIKWGALAGALMIAGGLILARTIYPSIAGVVQRTFEALALAPNAFPDGQAFFSYQAGNALLLALMLLGLAGVLWLMGSGRQITFRGFTWPAWQAAAAALIVVDLGAAVWGFYPANDARLLAAEPPALVWLKGRYAQDVQAGDPWRFIAYEEPGADTMNSNIGWLHGLEDASAYDSLIPGQYAAYMALIQPQTDLPYNRIAPIYASHPQALDSPLLDLLNVRYVVTETPIDSPKYEQVYQGDDLLIYQNLAAMPRAFTLPAASTLYVTPGEQTFEEAARLYDVRRHVLLGQAGSIFSPAPALPLLNTAGCIDADGCAADPGPAAITVYRPGQVWADVQIERRSWLILTESYYPGWRAFVRAFGSVEEQEVPVHLVNGNFRAVLLEPGAWTVRFSYSPDSARLGIFTSFMAGMVIIFAAGVIVWRYAYRESTEGSTAYRVARNSLTPILLNLFNRLIQFAFAVIMLRILGPEGSGRYQYAVVLWGWFEIVSNFGLDTLLMREVSRDKADANRYLANTAALRLMLALAGVPALGGFLWLRQNLIDPPLAPQTVIAIWVLYGGLFISTLSKGLTGLFYAFEKAEYPAALQTVAAMLTASLGVVALLSGYGIVGLAVVSVIVNAVTLGLLYAFTRRLFFAPRPAFDAGLVRAAAGESFPLMINHLLATVFFRIDIILLELITRSDRVLGWYGVTYKWVDAINVIPAFFTQALFPVMSRQASQDPQTLKRSYVFAIKLLSLVSLPTAVMTTLLADVLVGVLGGAEFLPYGALALRIFIWSIPFGWINSITNYVIIALNRQRVLTWAFIFGAAFNVGANLIFIPRYSFVAAAVTTILSEFVLLAFFYMVMLKPLGPLNWFQALWRLMAAAGLMGGAAWLLLPLGVWPALIGAGVFYAGAVLMLRPFDAFEQERLAGLLPERLRRHLPGGGVKPQVLPGAEP